MQLTTRPYAYNALKARPTFGGATEDAQIAKKVKESTAETAARELNISVVDVQDAVRRHEELKARQTDEN